MPSWFTLIIAFGLFPFFILLFCARLKILFHFNHSSFRLILRIDYTRWSKIFSSVYWIFVTFLGFMYLLPHTLGIFVIFYNQDKSNKFSFISSDCVLSSFNIPLEISTIFLGTPRKRIEYDITISCFHYPCPDTTL